MRNFRYIITAFIIISIVVTSLLTGCAGKTTSVSTPARKYEIVKTMDITDAQGVKIKIYQLRLTLDSGATFTIDLNLANNDEVECYYLTEKPMSGGNVSFQVKAGAVMVYPQSTTTSTVTGNTSDRLIVTATQVNGSSYRLIFKNNIPDNSTKETIYTEIQYPANLAGDDSIFIPLETN